jgi:hypothetical protein
MKLIIVESLNSFSKFNSVLSDSTEVLALNQKSMIELDRHNIKYRTIEELYNWNDYYKDVCIYYDKVNNLLAKLDGMVKGISNFPYSYSGNEHCFSTWFTDLLYLEKIITNIQKKYSKIYFFSTTKPEKLSSKHLNIYELVSHKSNGLSYVSLPSEKTESKVLQLLFNVASIIFVEDSFEKYKDIEFVHKIRYLINRCSRYLKKRIPKIKISKADKVEKNAYLVQGAFEMVYLKKYLPRFKYTNPTINLRKDIEIENPDSVKGIDITYVVKEFSDKNLPLLGAYFGSVMNSYHLEVVGRIKSFKNHFTNSIKEDKPVVLLYDIGIVDVFDSVCCHVANSYNIPVVLLQHGGHSMFSFNPYQKSLEFDQRILKTLITQSKEEALKIQNNKTKAMYMGSVQQYEESKVINTPPAKDVLFCVGPDVNLSFRFLLNYYSINKKHQQSLDIVSALKDTLLSADVKLHPSGEKDSYKCFLKIIKSTKSLKVSVIKGEFVEEISRQYKLIILDFLQSAIVKHIMLINVPIIIYDYNFLDLRVEEGVKSDLHERCYIAKNKDELKVYLQMYKAGRLPSKLTSDFIDKYLFPVNKENPGKNIAKYISNLTL